jgi:hypothetical protein
MVVSFDAVFAIFWHVCVLSLGELGHVFLLM